MVGDILGKVTSRGGWLVGGVAGQNTEKVQFRAKLFS